MVFLGTLSLMQIFLLPGLAVFSIAPRKMGIVEKALLIVLVSVLGNFVLIWLLVLLGAYVQVTLFAIVAIEIVAILYGAIRRLPNSGKVWVDGSINDSTGLRLSILDIATTLMFLFFCFAIFAWWVPYLGGPFLRADPNVIWNAWAKVWAAGSMPSNTSGYPQLLPELWSLVYVMSGSAEIQSFARSVNAFFPWISIAGLMLLLKENRKIAFILASGSILPFWFLSTPLRPYVFHGFADLPLASLILLFSVALVLRRGTESSSRIFIHIAGLAAIIAAATKLNGVFLCAALPLIVYVQDQKIFGNRQLNLAAIYSIAGMTFCIVWFVYFLVLLDAGQEDYRQFTAIPSSFADLWVYIQGIPKPAMEAWSKFGPITTSAIVAIFLLSLLDKKLWPLSVFVVLPFVLFWLIFLWYGPRNAIHTSGLFPLMFGMLVDRHLPQKTKNVLERKIFSLRMPAPQFSRLLSFAPILAFLSVSVALFILFLSPPVSDDELLKSEEKLKWTMGGVPAEVNRALMASFPISQGPTKVFTDHWPVFVLEAEAEIDFHWTPGFRRPPTLLARWIRNHPDGYVLLSRRISDEIRQFTEDMVKSGDYEIIFRQERLVLFAPKN